jgi:metal-responsive CopG/Arc/MetJ family transcriptional regulator
MAGKTERVELRLDEVLVKKVDDWRRTQGELYTRSEAVRRFVEQGLSISPNQAFTLMKTQLI